MRTIIYHDTIRISSEGSLMQTQDIVALILVYLVIVAALLLSQYVQKHNINWDSRKIVHIGVGAFIYIWWAFTENWIMLVFFAIPFEIVLFLAMFPGNPVSDSKLGELTNDMGHRYGLFLYVMSIIILVAFFFDHWVAATIGIVAMTRGDGFGSVIGKRYGRHKLFHGKSVEGSLGVFAATTIISFFVIMFYGFLYTSLPSDIAVNAMTVGVVAAIGYSILSGAIASVVEAIAPGDFDNLLIPMCVVIPLVLLGL